MPEGPEVRRCADQLRRGLLNKRLEQVLPISGKLGRKMPAVAWPEPPTVTEVVSKGKAIVVRLSNDQALVSTLGMSGWWYPDEVPVDAKAYVRGKLVAAAEVVKQAMKHERVKLLCADGSKMSYVDVRNFGNLSVVVGGEAQKYLDRIGPDLLWGILEAIDLQSLSPTLSAAAAALDKARTKHGSKTLGEMAVEQGLISGLGNIYRAETLYLAGHHPLKRLSTLTDEEVKSFVAIASTVLLNAYLTDGVMVYKDELLRDCMSKRLNGEVLKRAVTVQGHLVYGKPADPFGHPTKTLELGGRTVWYVPEMQRDSS